MRYLGLYERESQQRSENLAIQVVFVDPLPRPPDPLELEMERCGR
jgi:hypothetical protein